MIVNLNGSRFLKLIHRYSLERDGYTLKDFMEAERIFGIKEDELFKINKPHIYSQMTSEFKRRLKEEHGKYPESEGDVDINMPLPSPCFILVPLDNIDTETAISSTNFQDESSDFSMFYEEELMKITQDAGYSRMPSYSKGEERASVFGWFKSRSSIRNDKDMQPEFFDLSDYLISVNTNVTMQGGTFSIRLPFVHPFSITPNGLSIFKKDEGGDKMNRTELGDNRAFDFFSNMIGTNDLIFISFEKLLGDNRENIKKAKDTDQFIANLDAGIFDMIGLVDSVSIEKDFTSSMAYVNVSGRDLMKLLTDDGSYYYTIAMTSFAEEIFNNTDDIRSGDEFSILKKDGAVTSAVDRMRFMSGQLVPFANVKERRIKHIINTVITLLANIEICPDYLFTSYGDKRNKGVELRINKK